MKKYTLRFALPLLTVALLGFVLLPGDPEDEKRKPENAVANLQVTDGLQAQLFASEPMMTNPTDMDIDDRGRIWLCEAYNYRPDINGNPVKKEGDRILILEDTDGDAKADKSTVFYQGPEVASPLGIWVMGNRALVSQSPYLWLFTDTDGDDKADTKEIVLEGVGGTQHDHGLHAVVFGPDGKFYFNFGNAGETLKDKNGQTIQDEDGLPINLKNYRMGMVFRCDPDFTHFEVLGNNFRNNYEVAADSYGTLWQSDNDDDGNKGVRINYVMEFGNYGYTDEMTGAGWTVNRTNIEPEIPLRHWHQNDPGSIPNLLQTGAGSPCGMCVYEGDLLPERFRGQLIHADAGPNVVRAYVTKPDGAGYTAEINNIVQSLTDQWFRPSDVCVAPDGSLFIADWYDPGVGGHQAGDQNRGRVFRVAPPAAAAYKIPVFDLTTVEGAVSALQNPNLSVRWKAWNALHTYDFRAEEELGKLFKSSALPHLRARALWLLAKSTKPAQYIDLAARDADPNIRIVAIRAARQGGVPLIPILEKLVNDKNPQVRRECALALHHQYQEQVPELWATLAKQHDGIDRWYLEALGIGADGQWEVCLAAYKRAVGRFELNNVAQRDVIWRARCASACPLLGEMATNTIVPLEVRLRYFRAFDFQKPADAAPVLLKILRENTANAEVAKLALLHLDAELVKSTPDAKAALSTLMASLQGDAYLEFADRYQLPEENERLYNMILKNENSDKAAEILLKNPAGLAMFQKTVSDKTQETDALALLRAIRNSGGKTQLGILEAIAFNRKRSDVLRRQATEWMGNSWNGEEYVLELLKNKKIEKRFIPSAVQGVSHAWRMKVRLEAASYLDNADPATSKKIPAIADLLKLTGNPAKGVALFEQNCSTCHQVNGKGIDYGPKLSQIGAKLPPEGQYLAILHPSAGISYGYEGWEFKLKNGDKITGLIASQTEMELVLKMPGGTLRTVRQADITSRTELADSMMPTGFHQAMTEQELADLVAYLMTLK